MSVECPKCRSKNTDTAAFCSDCGTQIQPSDNLRANHTKTLETPMAGLKR